MVSGSALSASQAYSSVTVSPWNVRGLGIRLASGGSMLMKGQSNDELWPHRDVRGHLLLTNCLEDEVSRPNIELALKEDRLLWLDLADNDEETLTLLREVFKIHPLA